MTSMFLTDDEIEEITRRQWKKKQVETLRAMGIEHKQRPDGSIVVLRAHVEHVLGGTAPAKAEREWAPNWDALKPQVRLDGIRKRSR